MALNLVLNLFLILASFQNNPAQQPEKETAPSEAPYVERNQRHFNFYPGGKIEIFAAAPGSLKVIGWKRASVLVETERVIHGLGAGQAKALGEQFPVQLRWTQTLGTVRTAGPPPGTVSMEMNLTLYVPKEKTDLKIELLKGSLAVGSVNGWVEAVLQNGSVEAKSLNGYFSATTKMGDVDVEMAGKRWEGYGFTAVTQKGSVELRLPVDFSAALQLETRNGNLAIDFPEQIVDGETVPLTAIEKKNARTLTASVGTGGPSIRLMTFAGDIHLSKAHIP